MRNKKLITALMASTMLSAFSFTAFAASWQSDANGWWWQNDSGTYPVNAWKWIDGNNDNISERYYFNELGYMLANTTAPDGSTLNADGAWTVDGVVQTAQIMDVDSFGYTNNISNLIYDLMNNTRAVNEQKYGIPDVSAGVFVYPACPYLEVHYGMPDDLLAKNLGYDVEKDTPWIISVKSSQLSFGKIFADAPEINDMTSLDSIKAHLEGLGYDVIDAHSAIDSSDKRIAIELGRFDISFDAPSDGVLSSWVGDSGDFSMYVGQDMTEEAASAWSDLVHSPSAASHR